MHTSFARATVVLRSFMLFYLGGFELIEAFVEVLGYFCIVAAWLTGGLNVANFLPVIV